MSLIFKNISQHLLNLMNQTRHLHFLKKIFPLQWIFPAQCIQLLYLIDRKHITRQYLLLQNHFLPSIRHSQQRLLDILNLLLRTLPPPLADISTSILLLTINSPFDNNLEKPLLVAHKRINKRKLPIISHIKRTFVSTLYHPCMIVQIVYLDISRVNKFR